MNASLHCCSYSTENEEISNDLKQTITTVQTLLYDRVARNESLNVVIMIFLRSCSHGVTRIKLQLEPGLSSFMTLLTDAGPSSTPHISRPGRMPS